MAKEKLAFGFQTAAGVLLVGLSFLVADALRDHDVNVGDKAPNFTVTTDRGKQLSRSEFGGKVLVVNFWATWCPPCIDELPSLQAMAQQLGPRGVVVVGISVDKNAAAYTRFLQQAKVQFETSRDPEANISAEYGTFRFPETYVIDQEGKVRQKHIGPQDWMNPDVLKSIEGLL